MESDLAGIEHWIESRETNLEAKRQLKTLILAAQKGETAIESPPFTTSLPVTFSDGKLYFKRLYELEKQLNAYVEKKISEKGEISFQKPHQIDPSLLPEQAMALEGALDPSLFILTGGPGTGKTHTAAHILREMKRQVPSLLIAVAAPTGKAVGQLKKSLLKHLNERDFTAKTLHAFLTPYKDNCDILPYDVLLVDEASMIDLELMTRLFQSLRPGGRLILMGDPWQLPPVEAGAPFAPLVAKSPGMALTRCMRTDLKTIVELAEAIKQQDFNRLIALLKHPADGIEWIPHTDLTFTITEKMILTPLKKGPLGSQALNQKGLKECQGGPYPILITQNHHELELYNGDIGLLESLDIRPGVKAYFGERVVPAVLLPPWDLAWALSIHKSQGSEFDHLRLLLPDEAQGLSFKALYTGVTRAKKSCALHASEESLKALMNEN